MTVEILCRDDQEGVYWVLGYVHHGDWIQNDERWDAPTPFSDQLDGMGLLEDEDELVRKFDNPEMYARKVDPDERELDPEGNSPIEITTYSVGDGK